MKSQADRVLDLASKTGVLRPRDVVRQGIPRVILTRLVRAGLLVRVGRGLYSLPNADVSEHHALVEVCKKVPHGVVCLLSALRFHGLTTQDPFEVWLAIDRKSRKPRIEHPPLRIFRFSGDGLTYAVQVCRIEGVPVRLTSPARTVIDCFRYRNKVGIDVAIEALQDYRRLRKGTVDELWEAASRRRTSTVIRPYLEALS